MAYFIVPTRDGNVKGKLTKTKSNFPYYAFYKVPFAKPPTGNLRFALPQPPQPWTDTLDCSKKVVAQSLQVLIMRPDSKFLLGSEDCLYLNVFSPQMPEVGQSPPKSLPVIVFIHGGAFCTGNGDPRIYGPEYLIDKSVIVVTIHYRLGPLGFLSLGIDSVPGNQGMHDQVLALKWIQENISKFGGDNNNVTIMGESAGAMSCFLHLVSPLSKGLFHKVIALSGSATTPFMHNDRKPELYGQAFAKYLGAKTEMTNEEMASHLRSLSAKDLIHKTLLFKDWDVVSPMPWKPVVDDYASTPFLPVPFEEAIRSGHFDKNIPIIAGFTSEEGLIYTAPFEKSKRRWNLFFDEWDKWSPLLLFNRESDLISNLEVDAAKKVLEKFFPESRSSESPKNVPQFNDKNLQILTDIFSTTIFQAPLVHDLDLLVEHGAATVYAYYFSFKGVMSLVDVFRLPPFQLAMNLSARHFGMKLYHKELGACHGDDLLYLFPFAVPGFPNNLKTEHGQKVSRWMIESFTDFVKFGSPKPILIDPDTRIEWKPFTKLADEKFFLEFDTAPTCKVLGHDVRERINFWNDVVVSEGQLLNWAKSDKPIPKIHEKPAEKRSS